MSRRFLVLTGPDSESHIDLKSVIAINKDDSESSISFMLSSGSSIGNVLLPEDADIIIETWKDVLENE